jgi:hypothetical protein
LSLGWLSLRRSAVAARVTNSPWLWAIYFLCQVLLIFFLQVFFSWLFAMKFPQKVGQKSPAGSVRPGIWAVMRKARTVVIAAFAFFVWAAFQVGMQQVIGRSVDAIAEFQKAGRK